MSGSEIHYEITGPEDAPVLMLAGSLGSTLDMWDPQVEALSGRFRLLRYDHRGHGGSATPEGEYRVADLAGDALGLLDRLGIERVAFCGLSLGGMVGIWLGANAPERISSLVLCCTSAHFGDVTPWQERVAAVRARGTASIARTVVTRWFTPGWAAEHPEWVQRMVAMVSSADDEGYARCAEAVGAWDGRDMLGRISAPTLVIAGEHDPSTTLPHLKAIAAGIPGATLQVLDAAHMATIEQAAQANALIAEHLGAG